MSADEWSFSVVVIAILKNTHKYIHANIQLGGLM